MSLLQCPDAETHPRTMATATLSRRSHGFCKGTGDIRKRGGKCVACVCGPYQTPSCIVPFVLLHQEKSMFAHHPHHPQINYVHVHNAPTKKNENATYVACSCINRPPKVRHGTLSKGTIPCPPQRWAHRQTLPTAATAVQNLTHRSDGCDKWLKCTGFFVTF